MRRIVAGNWKMNKGPLEATRFLHDFLPACPIVMQRSLWLFPPAVTLGAVAQAVAQRNDVRTGVQNIHWEAAGAFTGETSAPMAKEAGAQVALVGHSERRHVFGETDEQVARKVSAALSSGLDVLLCVGEMLDERRAGRLEAVLERQLSTALERIDEALLTRVTLAYEPVWAIGTGVNATPDDAAGAHTFLRERIAARWGARRAQDTAILYGGSVSPENARSLMAATNVDGVLVGGASLKPDTFARIAAAALPA